MSRLGLTAIVLFLASPILTAQEAPPLKTSLKKLSSSLDTTMTSVRALDRALSRKTAGLDPVVRDLRGIRKDFKAASKALLATAGDCKGTLGGFQRQDKARIALRAVLLRIDKWSDSLLSDGIKGVDHLISAKEGEGKSKAYKSLKDVVGNSSRLKLATRSPRKSLQSLVSLCRDLGQVKETEKTKNLGKVEKTLLKEESKGLSEFPKPPKNCPQGYINTSSGSCVEKPKTEEQLAIEKSLKANPMENQPTLYDSMCGWSNCTLNYQPIQGPLFKVDAKGAPVINPNDVTQGNIGDCYLMASLAAIADKNPSAIRDMVQQNPDGTYSVRLYDTFRLISSQPQSTTLTFDNQFPVNSSNDRLIYAQSSEALWPMVLEKAYAKLNGNSYDQIGQGGYPGHALEMLTGVKSQTYNPSRVSLDNIAQWDKTGYAIVVGTNANDLPWPLNEITNFGASLGARIVIPDNPLFKNQTLVPRHAYYVESVDTVNGTVTLGNPWGWNTQHVTLTMEQFKRSISHVSVNVID